MPSKNSPIIHQRINILPSYEHWSRKTFTTMSYREDKDRIRLFDLLDKLLHALDHSGILLEYTQNSHLLPTRFSGSVLLVSKSGIRTLSLRLEHANFQVWHCETLEDTRAMLLGTSLTGAIIDLDLTANPEQVLDVVRQLDARIASRLPIFFLSERSDFAARLEAVRAGGAGYFTKPIDVNALIEQLYERLSNASVHGRRVLIINDEGEVAADIAQELQSKGITTHVINHPQRVLQTVHQFQPQLLILDLDLQTIDATHLAKLIQQHELCHDIPMLVTG